jgi:hypothetical protein
MYLSTKTAPQSINKAFDRNLDIPTGAIKEDTPFSQKTFLVGANQKMKASNMMNL